ncbi:MAG: sulfotransferase domain-containing protein [Desulfatibacillaceae bacterium]
MTTKGRVLPEPVKTGVLRARQFQRRLTAPLRSLPDFVIIGAQKAGTSSLHYYLAQHEQVGMSFDKEVHFFDLNHEKGVNWYRARFPLALAARRIAVGEASPYYMVHPHVPGRLHGLLPSARLILLLRDPTQRAVSHYFHEHRKGREPLPIMQALEAEEERIAGEWERMVADPSYTSRAHQSFSYKQRGHYAEQIERYLEYFDRKQTLVLQSERLFTDPAATVGEVCRFLGVEPPAGSLDYSARNVGMTRQRVNDEVRRYLDEYYAPRNRRLFELLDREFDW